MSTDYQINVEDKEIDDVAEEYATIVARKKIEEKKESGALTKTLAIDNNGYLYFYRSR